MDKVLMYVDAENVSKEDLDVVKTIKGSLDGQVFIGKFYGKFDALPGIMQDCYEQGLEYVETSSLHTSKKNLTDMKIVVDCVTDVCATYSGEVARVILLSHDCDFVPLVLKLKGSGVDIEMPLFDPNSKHETTTDLEVFLDGAGYNPMSRQDYLESQYCVICEITGDQFRNEIITGYLAKKKKKFIKDLSYNVDNSVIGILSSIDVKEFSFYKVAEVLRLSKVNTFSLQVFDTYTRKFYGESIQAGFREKVLDKALKKVSLSA